MDHDEMKAAMRRATEGDIPQHGDGRFILWQADCRQALAALPDCSVDAIVTDPPYELGFMGKSWDASGIAYDVELWRDVLRVIKPGGHLLAFGGSRTYHRLACAVEDAGFEIRDQIMWVYGSGFPKSLDVGKAIDKMHGPEKQQAIVTVTSWIAQARDNAGLMNTDIDKTFGLNTMARHWTDVPPKGKQPSVPTAEQWPKLLELLKVERPPQEVMDAVDKWLEIKGQPAPTWYEREVVGTSIGGIVPDKTKEAPRTVGGHSMEFNITAPATDAAKQWDGWGTALKPAHEPIVVARKPLEGTVAANVLKWGTGALNIDGCRVGTDDELPVAGGERVTTNAVLGKGLGVSSGRSAELGGRWPANFIHDGSDEVLELFPDVKAGKARTGHPGGTTFGGTPMGDEVVGTWYGDSGSAARFFYCAKAGKKERNAGLEHLEAKREHDGRQDGLPGGDNPRNRTNTPAQNHHPTVKPIALMRYLIRLITPPGGVVLDPFAGSGTTMVAALLEGVTPWGCEMTEEYVPIILGRVQWALDEIDSQLEGTL